MLFPPERIARSNPGDAAQIVTTTEARDARLVTGAELVTAGPLVTEGDLLTQGPLVTEAIPAVDTAEIVDLGAVANTGRVGVVDRLAEILVPIDVDESVDDIAEEIVEGARADAPDVDIPRNGRTEAVAVRGNVLWWPVVAVLLVGAVATSSTKLAFRKPPTRSVATAARPVPPAAQVQPILTPIVPAEDHPGLDSSAPRVRDATFHSDSNRSWANDEPWPGDAQGARRPKYTPHASRARGVKSPRSKIHSSPSRHPRPADSARKVSAGWVDPFAN